MKFAFRIALGSLLMTILLQTGYLVMPVSEKKDFERILQFIEIQNLNFYYHSFFSSSAPIIGTN
jgi:hypothetical protein